MSEDVILDLFFYAHANFKVHMPKSTLTQVTYVHSPELSRNPAGEKINCQTCIQLATYINAHIYSVSSCAVSTALCMAAIGSI